VRFKQLEDGQRFAEAAVEPTVNTALARMGSHLILKKGIFPNRCSKWRLLSDANQTFAKLIIHFAHQDCDGLDSAGYSGACQSGSLMFLRFPPGSGLWHPSHSQQWHCIGSHDSPVQSGPHYPANATKGPALAPCPAAPPKSDGRTAVPPMVIIQVLHVKMVPPPSAIKWAVV
jgi:hypothetical protein